MFSRTIQTVLATAVLLTVAGGFSGCESSDQLFGTNSDGAAIEIKQDLNTGEFQGCIEGQAIDQETIEVQFEFPERAKKMSIYRNGILAYSSVTKDDTVFRDIGLSEGVSYRYTCEALIDGQPKMGSKSLLRSPTSVSAPLFTNGIDSAIAQSATSVLVSWSPADKNGPVKAAYYLVYGNMITSSSSPKVKWEQPYLKKVTTGTYKTVISGLGDELPYAFGVRACSAADICDTNVDEDTVTLGDDGLAPKTVGAESVSVVNSVPTIVAPWDYTKGAIRKRHVYVSASADPASFPTAPYKTVDVITTSPTLTNPLTSIPVTGLAQRTQYYFMVRDEDPTNGLISTNNRVVSLNTGDMSPPSFTGILDLSYGDLLGNNKDTALTAVWTAVSPESGGNPDGATNYVVSYSTGSTNPCVTGTEIPLISASSNVAGDTMKAAITGLTPRTAYNVCVRARDSSENTSTNTFFITRTTWDVTPPTFDGIQTFDERTLAMTWNPVTPPGDILNYRIRIWVTPKPTIADPNPSENATPAILTRNHGTFSSGFTLTTDDGVSFVEGDTLRIVVDACDNASSLGNGSVNNCTDKCVGGLPGAQCKSVTKTIPDRTPPKNFPGVKSASYLACGANQGEVKVVWSAPPISGYDSDYAGFNIYNVDSSTRALSPLKLNVDCGGASVKNCATNPLTEITFQTGFFRRTFNFYVSAYDKSGNETIDRTQPLAGDQVYTAFRTCDTEAPQNFSSNISASLIQSTGPGTGGLKISWTGASADNQYVDEPGRAIVYTVYRLKNALFTVPGIPELGGAGPTASVIVATVNGQLGGSYSFDDLLSNLTNPVEEGYTYYYVACAADASNNRVCDGATVASKLVDDMTSPTVVISNLATLSDEARDLSVKTWSLAWTVSDNVAPLNTWVSVRSGETATRPADAAAAALAVPLSNPVIAEGANLMALANQGASAKTKGYITYRITARDKGGTGNTGEAFITIKYDNKGPDAASNVVWREAPHSSAKLLNADWTPSGSPGLYAQRIYIYESADCSGASTYSTTLPAITTATYSPPLVAIGEGKTYSFKIVSADNILNENPSDCSPPVDVFTSMDPAQSTLESSRTTVPADGTTPAVITATVKNTFGVPIAGKTVTLSSTRGVLDTIASLGGAVTASNGQLQFSVKSTSIGPPDTSTISANVAGTAFLQEPSLTWFTSAHAGNSTVIATSPTWPNPIVADGLNVATVEVTLKDVFNNLLAGKLVKLEPTDPSRTSDIISPIQIATGDGGAQPLGKAVFTVLTTKSGAASYRATVISDTITVTQQAQVNWVAGPATKLVFTTQPTNTFAGDAIRASGNNDVKVAIQDANDNVVTSALGNITMSIDNNPAAGTLTGTNPVALASGVAAFTNLKINRNGNGYTLKATYSGAPLTVSSTLFDINLGPPTKLVFTTQPQTSRAGNNTIAPTISITDQADNIVSAASATITLAIGTNPSSGTLSNAGAAATSGGFYTFSSASINRVGTGYTLTATASGALHLGSPVTLTSATSSAFNITANDPHHSVMSLPAGEVLINVCNGPFSIQLEDLNNNNTTTAAPRTAIMSLVSPGGGATATFFTSSANCTNNIPGSPEIAAGSGNTTFYVKFNTGGTNRIQVEFGGLQSATLDVPVLRKVIFTTPGSSNWTVPAGVTTISAKLWGAGGGGGGCDTWSCGTTGNHKGGHGAYIKDNISVSENQVLTVIVGQGGASQYTYGNTLVVGRGGGRSAITRSGVALITAGGGGGAPATSTNSGATGGNGGYPNGQNGGTPGGLSIGGLAGTQSAPGGASSGYYPGSAGSGTAGGWGGVLCPTCSFVGGEGGHGCYGGGGGGVHNGNFEGGAGGGGSSCSAAGPGGAAPVEHGVAGTGVGGSANSDYSAGAGLGSTTRLVGGANGRVVITY